MVKGELVDKIFKEKGMKLISLRWWVFLWISLAGAFCASLWAGENKEEAEKFVFYAVLEGLCNDGVQSDVVRMVINNPDNYFVPKCPVCKNVERAFDSYLKVGIKFGRGLST